MGLKFNLLAAMDACRPSHDDLADPLLAPLAAAVAGDPQMDDRWQRQQKLDVALGGALQDVPVPDGLTERLLAALGNARAAKATLAAAAAAGAAAGSACQPPAAKAAGRRRPPPAPAGRWLVVCRRRGRGGRAGLRHAGVGYRPP